MVLNVVSMFLAKPLDDAYLEFIAAVVIAGVGDVKNLAMLAWAAQKVGVDAEKRGVVASNDGGLRGGSVRLRGGGAAGGGGGGLAAAATRATGAGGGGHFCGFSFCLGAGLVRVERNWGVQG